MSDQTPQRSSVLPRNFLRACLLLLLKEHAAHGYDLLERLEPFGFLRSDPGGVYRALRSLEEEGHVKSGWEPSDQGPQRRIYELTREGAEELHALAEGLLESRETVDAFLGRYEEFVALGRRRGRAPATPRK